MRYDRAASQRIMALAETPEMRDQRRHVIELLAPRRGWRVLDVGCGPGHLAEELAAAVGPEGAVCAVDVSPAMLALARGRGSIEFERVHGTELPYTDDMFDAVVASQVYEFIEALPAALRELHRVIRPGGAAVILDTDWDSLVWASGDAERMSRVLAGWRRRVARPHLPRTLAGELREVGLRVVDRLSYVIFDPYGHPNSYSALQIKHLGASAVGVAESEIRDWAEDLRGRARDGEYFFSVNRYLFRAVKASCEPAERRSSPAPRPGATSVDGLEIAVGDIGVEASNDQDRADHERDAEHSRRADRFV